MNSKAEMLSVAGVCTQSEFVCEVHSVTQLYNRVSIVSENPTEWYVLIAAHPVIAIAVTFSEVFFLFYLLILIQMISVILNDQLNIVLRPPVFSV